MYVIEELSFADTRRILQYRSNEIFGTKFNLKGFNYPWILSARSWSEGDRVLDVGAGYSQLPMHIAREYGCEVWAVDDFGTTSDEAFWERNAEPQQHVKANPQVKFVIERLGDPERSSLPEGYFNCIYSASALEHVPEQQIHRVWSHMDRLLRPGGELIHGLDFRLPLGRGWLSVVKAMLIDRLQPVLPPGQRIKYAYYTPNSYLRVAFAGLGAQLRVPKGHTGVLNFVLDPAVLLEPIDWAFNRMVKDGMMEIPAQRVGSLLIRLRKSSGTQEGHGDA